MLLAVLLTIVCSSVLAGHWLQRRGSHFAVLVIAAPAAILWAIACATLGNLALVVWAVWMVRQLVARRPVWAQLAAVVLLGASSAIAAVGTYANGTATL